MNKPALIAAAALGLAPGAVCADADGGADGRPHSHWYLEAEGSWYAGVALGQGSFDRSAARYVDDGSLAASSADDSDLGYRMFGGLRFLELGPTQWAVELGYFDGGEQTGQADSDGTSFLWNAGPVAADVSVEGFDLALVGVLRMGERWLAQARTGIVAWESDFRFAGDRQGFGPFDFTSKADGSKPVLGAGVGYAWPSWRLVVEYSRFDFTPVRGGDNERLETLGLSVSYAFGL